MSLTLKVVWSGGCKSPATNPDVVAMLLTELAKTGRTVEDVTVNGQSVDFVNLSDGWNRGASWRDFVNFPKPGDGVAAAVNSLTPEQTADGVLALLRARNESADLDRLVRVAARLLRMNRHKPDCIATSVSNAVALINAAKSSMPLIIRPAQNKSSAG